MYTLQLYTANIKIEDMENVLHTEENIPESCLGDLVEPSQYLEFSVLNKIENKNSLNTLTEADFDGQRVHL